MNRYPYATRTVTESMPAVPATTVLMPVLSARAPMLRLRSPYQRTNYMPLLEQAAVAPTMAAGHYAVNVKHPARRLLYVPSLVPQT